MERSTMEKYQEIMKGHYVRELSGTIFIAFLSVVTLVFILIAIKKWEIPKWFLLLWVIILLIDICSAIKVKSMKDDMQNQSYITYHGEYYQICKGLEEHQTTTIYIDGKEKHLFSSHEMTNNGTFYGYVVYSERSGYVVYVGEIHPDQNK